MSTKDKTQLIEKINTALNGIRPHLAVDGGNIEVVDVTDNFIVKIKWLGSCENCSMTAMTMRAGVEQTIKGLVPEINEVVAINGI